MGRKKLNIKVKEIKNNVKIVSKSSEKETKNVSLEDEVSSDELPSESQSSRLALLKNTESIQVIPRESTTSSNVMKEDQAMFSQSRIYSSSSAPVPEQRTYVSPEEASRRFNPSLSSSSSLPLSRGPNTFDNLDMNKSSSNSHRDYNKPLDLKQEEKKKRMPWEI